jgi:hypothetical protein
MNAPEVPLEQAQEELAHHAEIARERWIMNVALTAAILAVLAAVAALMAEHQATHAMMDQIQSSDKWSYYQAKSIKANLLDTKTELLEGLGKGASQSDSERKDKYAREQEKIKGEAEELQEESKARLHAHTVLSRSVTMFQIGIAVAAISVLTKRKRFWLGSLLFGALGAFFFVSGLGWLDALWPR